MTRAVTSRQVPIDEVVRGLIVDGMTPTDIAAEIGVSQDTVERWAAAGNKPRAQYEGSLRALHSSLAVNDQRAQYNLFDAGTAALRSDVRTLIDSTLADLREALHRRGRLASANDALEEIAKLLFAHVMGQAHGPHGISVEALGSEGAAEVLRSFVREAFRRHLPVSLAHEMAVSDFELRLGVREDRLAVEIMECFEHLAAWGTTSQIAGPNGLDILNDVFGKLLSTSFVDEKELGQYLTPTEVVDFMVRLALTDLDANERAALLDPERCTDFGVVLDPSCGTASFLTEFLRLVYPSVIDKSGEVDSRRWLAKMMHEVIVGFEKSERMMRLALTNLAMFGTPAAKLHLINALARSGSEGQATDEFQGKVGLILTNPPFGAEFRANDLHGYRMARNGSLRSHIDSEILFIERYIDWLRPGGQLLAIVPDSVLTNRGIYDELRRLLEPQVEVRSVVSLPPVTFAAAGTSTKTSILHLRKLRSGVSRQGRALFAISRDVGFNVATRGAQRRKVDSGKGDLPLILRALSGDPESASRVRRVADVESYRRWDATYHASLSMDVVFRLEQPEIGDLRLSDLAVISNERADPRRWGGESFRYIEISDVDSVTLAVHWKEVRCTDAPSRARKLVGAGDVLLSTVRPERKTVGVVREDQDGCVCTTGFAVLRPAGVHPLVLARVLQSDFVTAQLMRNNIGIAYPAIDESCLSEILLPLGANNLHRLAALADEVVQCEEKTRAARSKLDDETSSEMGAWDAQGLVESPDRINGRKPASVPDRA